MKKITLSILTLISSLSVFSQTPEKNEFNRWSVEFQAGNSKGITPYSSGYFSSTNNKILGKFSFNSFQIGARYMISPIFGVRSDVAYDKFVNNESTKSKPFENYQYRFSLQATVNLMRLLNLETKANRIGLLAHAGAVYSRFSSQNSAINVSENNIGIVFGISPTFRISNKTAIFVDLSSLTNYRQHINWDGYGYNTGSDLSGKMISGTLGISYALGKNKIHGDWAVIEAPKSDKVKELNDKIGKLETKMDDMDKDGVPDYLDQENNSVAGVAVDSKGKMVDTNKNGVPDELESYLAKNLESKEQALANEQDMIKRLINQGFIAANFQPNKSAPSNLSTQGIAFILNYLRNNPSVSLDLIGHPDDLKNTPNNTKLATLRAESIKIILIQSGIEASRLNVVSISADNGTNVDTSNESNLLKKVTFKVK